MAGAEHQRNVHDPGGVYPVLGNQLGIEDFGRGSLKTEHHVETRDLSSSFEPGSPWGFLEIMVHSSFDYSFFNFFYVNFVHSLPDPLSPYSYSIIGLVFSLNFPCNIRYGFPPFEKRSQKGRGVFHPTWCSSLWQRIIGFCIIYLYLCSMFIFLNLHSVFLPLVII